MLTNARLNTSPNPGEELSQAPNTSTEPWCRRPPRGHVGTGRVDIAKPREARRLVPGDATHLAHKRAPVEGRVCCRPMVCESHQISDPLATSNEPRGVIISVYPIARQGFVHCDATAPPSNTNPHFPICSMHKPAIEPAAGLIGRSPNHYAGRADSVVLVQGMQSVGSKGRH